MLLTIREWRRLKEITLEQMAKDFEVTRQTVANWEDHPEALRVETVLKIAKYLDIDFSEIRFDALTDDKNLSEEA